MRAHPGSSVFGCTDESAGTPEIHLRSDRAAIAYRQCLRQLGLTFGAA